MTAPTRRMLSVSAPVVIIVLILLLLRSCERKPEPAATALEALFVPRDLARLKNLDREGVLEYCRTQIKPADYEGVLRGAHGALWAGEANRWDRVLLAAAALEGMQMETRIMPGDPPRLAYKDGERWTTVRLEGAADAEQTPEPPADSIALAELSARRPELFHTIQAVFITDSDGAGPARIEAGKPQPVADWVYQPVTINTAGQGAGMRYQLQVGNQVIGSVGTEGVRRARLELTCRFKDRTSVWTRELFDRENAKPEIPGRDLPRAGDRHAIVVAAGPLLPEVLETRARMIELPLYTPVDDEPTRELLRLGAKYQIDSDERTRMLAKECEVKVSWNEPRITIVSAETAADAKAAPGLSVDALADKVEASGARAREFHVARGLATDLVETRVVYEARKIPVVSTSTVFSNFKADSPDSPVRRVARIEAEANRMIREEPIGSTVVLTAMPPRSAPADEAKTAPAEPKLIIERTSAGLAIRGLAKRDAGAAPWESYEWKEDGSVPFADRTRELATVADGMLCRRAGWLDYLLAFEVRTAWPRKSLPVATGTILTYVAHSKGKMERIAVEIGLANGVPTGVWRNLDTNKTGKIVGQWPEVMTVNEGGMSLGTFLGPIGNGEVIKVPVRVGENSREAEGRKQAIVDGSAIILADNGLPIVLAWQRVDASLKLESASTVVRGSTRDAETGLPAAAKVALTRKVPKSETPIELCKADTAADGSFALAVPPVRRRLILILDRSGSMVFSLDPKDEKRAPAGKQRIDHLRKAVNGLLDKVPTGTEVALWSFSTGPLDRDNDSPRHTKIDCPFTTELSVVRKALAAITPTGGTPITGVVHKILDHVAQDPLSADAQIVLLTDGENSSRNSAAKAYRDRRGGFAIHTIGFAIEPGGKAEHDLRELSEASGGRFQLAGTGAELELAFGQVGAAAPDTRLAVTSTCHAPTDVLIPAAKLDEKLDLKLTHGCAACKCTGKSFIAVGKETVGRLAACEGLSPKARTMIEERVKDGLWTVTVPSTRVNLGLISAYAWWETENATGRMVGRTEDGLHGASIDPASWPGAAAERAGNIPFVAWYMGIVSYTVGSVDSAMRWTREPGFMAGGPEGFKRFVQANALDFAGRWWSEVGASAFPENMHNYWSGVCLNFTLQSAALGLPGSGCFRQWAGAMCDQAAGAARDLPETVGGKWFDDHYGPEYRDLYGRAKKWAAREGASEAEQAAAKEFFGEFDRFKKGWDDGVGRTFNCERFRARP